MDLENEDRANESTPLFDATRARNYLAFAKGALRRHKGLVALVVVLIVAATVVALWALPKTYHVEAKVLTQNNAALTVRADNSGNDTPTRTAAETVLRRDNLVALIAQTDLVRHYQDHRAPAERARDAILRLLGGQTDTDQDRTDSMVELLEKRLSVWTNESGNTVSIAIDWPDAQMASRIVDAAQQNYLEARYAQEITALGEAIAILQSHADSSRSDVDDAVAALQTVRAEKEKPPASAPAVASRSRSAPAPVPAAAPVHRPTGPTPEQAQLKVSIDAKQHALDDLEDFRNRRLSDLRGRLADQQAIYTESHPAVVDLKQAIAAMSSESPQVKNLRSEISALKAEYDNKTPPSLADPPTASTVARGSSAFDPAPPQLPAEVLRLDLDLREDRDPNIMYARGQLRDAMDKYATLRAHIQTAQIDLETAKAAFKYRYSVVTPAHVPKKPAKPNAPMVIVASFVAALLVGAMLGIIADLREGRVVERWQLERLLDRPIVADIELPRLPEAGPE